MSSTINDVRKAIETAFSVELAKSPAYPVSFPNVPFTPPSDGIWLLLEIQFGDSAYATLLEPTPGFNRQTGAMVISIFTPVGVGSGPNYTIVERVKKLFDRAKFAGIIFDAMSGPSRQTAVVGETGRVNASDALSAAYFQTQMTVTFDAFLD